MRSFILRWLKWARYLPGRTPKSRKRRREQATFAVPICDFRRPENWPILFRYKNLDPRVRQLIGKMQILATYDGWRPDPPGKLWADPY